jgi:alpha-L-rhamnosidase
MNSFNHYSLGSVGAWLYSGAAGIQPACVAEADTVNRQEQSSKMDSEPLLGDTSARRRPDDSSPGYKHFFLQPQFTARLSHLQTSLDSPYGLIVSSWQVDKDQVHYDVTVPPNTSALLILPVPARDVRQSGRPLPAANGPVTRLPLVAGTYHFSLPFRLIR